MLIPANAIFTSMHDMDQLLKKEQKFIQHLFQYIQKMESSLIQLKKLETTFKEVQSVVQTDGNKHLDNPINGFLLVIRATTEWSMVESIIPNMGLIPKDKDEELSNPKLIQSGAIQAILRLKSVYNFSPIDLANNEIFKEPYLHLFNTPIDSKNRSKILKMKGRSCYYIGVECLKLSDYTCAIDWFTIALIKLKDDESIHEVRIQVLQRLPRLQVGSPILFCGKSIELDSLLAKDYGIKKLVIILILQINVLNGLETSFFKSGRINDAMRVQSRILEMVPPTEQIMAEKSSYRALLKNNLRNEDELFHKLCRDGDQVSIGKKSKFKCYFLDTRKRHYSLWISKIKVEQAYMNPEILIFHDFFSHLEMETLKRDSIPDIDYFQQFFFNQEQSLVKSLKTVVRSSKEWKLDDADSNHKIAQRITRRIEFYTGLNTRKAFFVFNYGLGGHQNQHYDSSVVSTDFGSKQLATSNGFISDVREGGATNFIYLGISIQPIKGSVIFWYNLDRDGLIDARMRHGACPVLIGNKWTILHPFHIERNELNHPCPPRVKVINLK